MEKNEIFKKTEIYFLLSNMTLSGIIQTKNSKSLEVRLSSDWTCPNLSLTNTTKNQPPKFKKM